HRETERLKDAWAQYDEARAMRAVTDEMVLALSATETPDDIALRLDALLQAGLKQARFNPYWPLLISAGALLVPAKVGR
ncbi:MAG TPA: hypothetical protein VFD67_01620, partial [Gemmatimonadaceae bacterium]|nr:hypothetical protein [Gemmatimonadaceae bacterium]